MSHLEVILTCGLPNAAQLFFFFFKYMPANAGLRGDSGLSLSREDLLEEKTAAHLSILAWKVPWTEELGELYSHGMQKVTHN